MKNKTIKTLTSGELHILSGLFDYKNPDEMIEENTLRIESGAIDIFGLFENSHLLGELRAMYENDDELFAVKGKRAYLYAFRIHKDFRGQGLGKYLLRNVISALSERGYTEFTVGVEDDNERAIHIYNSLGFNDVIARKQEEYQGDRYEYNLYLKH